MTIRKQSDERVNDLFSSNLRCSSVSLSFECKRLEQVVRTYLSAMGVSVVAGSGPSSGNVLLTDTGNMCCGDVIKVPLPMRISKFISLLSEGVPRSQSSRPGPASEPGLCQASDELICRAKTILICEDVKMI